MLVGFSVGNYRSFQDVETLSLTAAHLSARDKEVDENNVFAAEEHLRLLTSAAVYGANASGKSNLTHAIRFMKEFVLNSSRESQAMEPIDVERFRLSAETAERPSFFEVVFLTDGRRYRYGFEVDPERVVSEWLFHVPSSRESRLFERTLSGFTLSSAFKEGQGLTEKTRPNALFLSVVAQFNGSIATKILGWFRHVNVVSGLADAAVREFTVREFLKPGGKDEILRFVQSLDLGISDIAVEKVSLTPDAMPRGLPDVLSKLILSLPGPVEQTSIQTVHHKLDAHGAEGAVEVFDLDRHESHGTQKLFSFAGPFLDTLRNGKVLVVDELDARLHPIVTKAIVCMFNSKTSNPHNAQLVFTTHDTNLLSNKIFRRDQVWFTEKDRYGATHLVSLAEYKVRNDASFERDYVRGRYGAIPFIGDLEELVAQPDA